MPKSTEMVDRQIALSTISSVFAGFSFTALSLLLGLSSDELIERIKNTTIMSDKVQRIMYSIVYLVISDIFSLYFILGLNEISFIDRQTQSVVDFIIYGFSVGTMMIGMGYFVRCVFELYDLVKKIYDQKQTNNDNIQKALEEKKNNQALLRRYGDNEEDDC